MKFFITATVSFFLSFVLSFFLSSSFSICSFFSFWLYLLSLCVSVFFNSWECMLVQNSSYSVQFKRFLFLILISKRHIMEKHAWFLLQCSLRSINNLQRRLAMGCWTVDNNFFYKIHQVHSFILLWWKKWVKLVNEVMIVINRVSTIYVTERSRRWLKDVRLCGGL